MEDYKKRSKHLINDCVPHNRIYLLVLSSAIILQWLLYVADSSYKLTIFLFDFRHFVYIFLINIKLFLIKLITVILQLYLFTVCL